MSQPHFPSINCNIFNAFPSSLLVMHFPSFFLPLLDKVALFSSYVTSCTTLDKLFT